MATRFIKSAWDAYRKNFWTILGANILFIAIVIAILLASIAPFIGAAINAGIFSKRTAPLSAEQDALLVSAISANIATFFIGILILAIAATALRTGLVGIYANALNNKKTEIGTMFSLAKEKFWASIGSSIIAGAIVMAVAAVLIVPTSVIFAGSVNAGAALIFAEIIIIVLFALLFALRNQAIVVGNLDAMEAVRSSYRTVKGNYLEFLSITLILVVISIIVSIIPVLGVIISIFLVQPLMDTAYTAFYMEKAGRPARKVAAAKKKGR